MLRQALLSLLAVSAVSAGIIPVSDVKIEKRDIDLNVLGTTFEVKITGRVSENPDGSKNSRDLESSGNIVLTTGGDGHCHKRRRGHCIDKPHFLENLDSDLVDEDNLVDSTECYQRGGRTCCNLGKYGWKCYIASETANEADALDLPSSNSNECYKRGGRTCCNLGKWGWKCYIASESANEVETLDSEPANSNECYKRGGRTCCNLGKWGWKCYIATELDSNVKSLDSSEPVESSECYKRGGRTCCNLGKWGWKCYITIEQATATDVDRLDSEPVDSQNFCWQKGAGRYCCFRLGVVKCSEFPKAPPKDGDGGDGGKDGDGKTLAIADDVDEAGCTHFDSGVTCCFNRRTGQGPICYQPQQLRSSTDTCYKRGRLTCCWDGVGAWICRPLAADSEVSVTECFTLPNPRTGKRDKCCPNGHGGFVCQPPLTETETTSSKCYKRLKEICCPNSAGKYVCKKFGPGISTTESDTDLEATTRPACYKRLNEICCPGPKGKYICKKIRAAEIELDTAKPSCYKIQDKLCCPVPSGGYKCQKIKPPHTATIDEEVDPAKPRCYKRLRQICCPVAGGRYICKKIPMELESIIDEQTSEDTEVELTIGEHIVLAEFGTGDDGVTITSGNVVVTLSPEGEMKNGKAKLVGEQADGTVVYLEGNISGQRVLA